MLPSSMLALALLAVLSPAPADLTAVGIVVGPRPEAAVAILRSGGRSRVVGTGDTAFGGRVARIASATVTLEFADGTRELRLAAASASGPASPLAAPPEAAESAADEAAATREMGRVEVERRLGAEIPRILAETTILPVSDGSRTVGFTLTRVPEGSLLTDAGLRPGDVLTHVNDVAIDSLPTLIGLWSRLQTATTVRANVLRNGQPISLTVNLR
jgi:type II secretory pathway component PulC